MRGKRKEMRWLLARALSYEDKEAYRYLGIFWLKGIGCRKDQKLGRICLKRAMELGDERSFWLYHRYFSKGKKVIEDEAYREMRKDYEEEENPREKEKLKQYLRLGTEKQKEVNP